MIELFTYLNTFSSCAKYRPGFRTPDGVLWVLTHTQPTEGVQTILIEASLIESEHFKPKTETLYLTPAENQKAARYNNISGGILKIDFSLLNNNINEYQKV